MKTVGVIPARWASTRLPGKSLVQICGKPLIQRVVERVKLAKRLDAVLVATDDKRIADVVNSLGVQAVMTRPDHPSGTDRIAEALKGVKADIIINIQGDEPLIDPKLIDSLAEVMAADRKWDMGTAAAPITNDNDLNNPSVVKVVWDENGRALYFSRSVIPFVRDRNPQRYEELHWRHIGIYAYRKSFLEKFVKTPPSLLEKAEKLEQLRALHIGGKIVVIQTAETGIGVDTPDDVKYVEKIIRKGGWVT
jgi:3-deoxy-manno-octulosonate cytidylyltransferase (CMP-KDO synthetase)